METNFVSLFATSLVAGLSPNGIKSSACTSTFQIQFLSSHFPRRALHRCKQQAKQYHKLTEPSSDCQRKLTGCRLIKLVACFSVSIRRLIAIHFSQLNHRNISASVSQLLRRAFAEQGEEIRHEKSQRFASRSFKPPASSSFFFCFPFSSPLKSVNKAGAVSI
jgi:hypothetical protein